MSNLTQRESVFQAICEVLGFDGFDTVVMLSKDDKAKVNTIVTDAIMAKVVDFSDEARIKYSTADKVSGYVNGMITNWLKKDPRLNGGVKYVAKNPGSRAGQGDSTLKELKKLMTIVSDADQRVAIEAAIETRKSEIATEKAKTVTLDLTKIPDDLKAKLGLS